VDALLSFSKLPLRLALVSGAVGIGLSFVIAAYAGARLFWHPAEFSWGLAMMLMSVYLVGGGILCGLGIVGEYVGRIYEQVKARPLYVLKEKSPDDEATAQPGKWQAAPLWKRPEAA
jgi:polyisoprenyl-phosphate glycosyltransferase